MSKSTIRSVETASGAPRRLDFSDRCTLKLRPDAFDRLADAALDIERKADGSPNVSALIRLRSGTATDFARDERLGVRSIARVLFLHAQRRGCTPGEAFDDLFEIHVERATTDEVAA